MKLFLSKKDEMAALSQMYGAPAIDVPIVFESLAEWAGDIQREIE